MRDPTDRPAGHHKARDRALVMPLIGLILLTPPVAGIFDIDARIGGVPATLVYIFAVWALLVVAGAAAARRLRGTDEAGPLPAPDEPGAPGRTRPED